MKIKELRKKRMMYTIDYPKKSKFTTVKKEKPQEN
jgi:hypothetical protein